MAVRHDKMGEQLSTDWDFDEDENSGQPQNKGGGLRAQLEQALKDNKELRGKLDAAEKNLRKEAVTRVISGKGYKPKLAKLIPADVEPTDEGITKWLDEYGDLFGVDNMKEQQEQQQQTDTASAEDDGANSEFAQQLAAMGRTTAGAQPPVKQEDILKRLQDPSLEKKALLEMIAAQGGGYGSG